MADAGRTDSAVMPQVDCQVLKSRHSLFYFAGLAKLVRTPHQLQSLPLGGANCSWKEISVDRLFAAKIVTSGESQGRQAHYLYL